MIVRGFQGKQPSLGARVFVAPNAAVIGDVALADDVSIWYGTTIRGDVNYVRIGARANIQDNCTIHVNHDNCPTDIAAEVTVGHGAIVHGCTVGRGALIGMGSRILDGAVIGENALIGAGAVISEGMIVPPRTLVLGVPGRIRRQLTEEEVEGLEASWKHYVEYKDIYLKDESS